MNDFISFKTWALENGYKDNLTIDRINNDGNYEPSNCRFITIAENSRNRSSTKLNWKAVKEIRQRYKNENISQYKLADEYNVSRCTIGDIVNNNRWKLHGKY